MKNTFTQTVTYTYNPKNNIIKQQVDFMEESGFQFAEFQFHKKSTVWAKAVWQHKKYTDLKISMYRSKQVTKKDLSAVFDKI